MLKSIYQAWDNLFLQLRPSIGLSFFRIGIALTCGLHVIPSFFHLQDNYLQTAFVEHNHHFFTPGFINIIANNPDWMVYIVCGVFCLSWFFFLIGFYAQASCIALLLSSNYFYARNALHVGTLSWDILLVPLFLMCLVPYHGDYFSVDSLRRGGAFIYKRKRPFFIQRLLQIQIAAVYFFTALHKITGKGNWHTDNPIYYLLNYPETGVTKMFWLREYFAARPQLCYEIGIGVVCMELMLPILLFMRKTRIAGIVIGFAFHIMLVVTLHVPTIFFFLFPPQLLLFIDPRLIVKCIRGARFRNRQKKQMIILYDGSCAFCRSAVRKVMVLDIFSRCRYRDYHKSLNLFERYPDIKSDECGREIHLLCEKDTVKKGFFVFRYLALRLPMLYPFIPAFFFPGTGFIGPIVYRWIAANRHRLGGGCSLNKTQG